MTTARSAVATGPVTDGAGVAGSESSGSGTGASNKDAPSRAALVAAFLCIYTVWGSTYLGIKFAVETLPPFFTGAVRFLVAGGLLMAWSVWRGARRPTRPELQSALIIGGALLFVGNGAVSWASHRVPSGMTSLLVATVPLWVVLLESARGRTPTFPQLLGVVIGLVGVGLLVLPANGSWQSAPVDPLGAAVLTLSSLSWTAGSLYSRSARQHASPTMASSLQMVCGGVLLLGLSLLVGEPGRVQWDAVTLKSIGAVGYLIVAGSLIGFSTYMWLLRHASPTAVGTYAYVNPAVAVALGVAFAGERLPARAALAMAVIVGGVALVSLMGRPQRR